MWTGVLLILPLLAVGALLALQAAANVQLNLAVGSPFGAALLQLGVGAAILLAVTLGSGAAGAFACLADATPWHLLGGLGSAVYITAGILMFPRLGAVVSVGLFATGQMLASLALDVGGLLGVPAEPLDAAAVAAVVAVLAGAALVVRGQSGARPRGAAGFGWTALALVAGAALPVQGAVNGRLREDLGEAPAVAAVSFLVAVVAMAAVLGVAVLGAGAPAARLHDLGRLPWWGWLGGVAGATYVTAVFLAIPSVGAASTVALTVAGQQLGGVAVDRYGLLRLPRRPVTTVRLAGVALLLAGVAALQLG